MYNGTMLIPITRFIFMFFCFLLFLSSLGEGGVMVMVGFIFACFFVVVFLGGR